MADAAGVTGILVELEENGLVRRTGSAPAKRWSTTQQGWLLGNEVFGAVWAAPALEAPLGR
jgi:hypothetical protein